MAIAPAVSSTINPATSTLPFASPSGPPTPAPTFEDMKEAEFAFRTDLSVTKPVEVGSPEATILCDGIEETTEIFLEQSSNVKTDVISCEITGVSVIEDQNPAGRLLQVLSVQVEQFGL